MGLLFFHYGGWLCGGMGCVSFFASGGGGESVGEIKIKNLLLPLLHVRGKKKNNVVQNDTVSGFSLFFK
jgi:hypothetical protein